jgi:hypothetical protein
VNIREAVLCLALIAAPVLAVGTAHAGVDCVTYSVTGPVIGTRSGTRCTPNLPPPLTQPFSDQQCGGVPPANTTFCATVTVYTP